MYISNSSTGYLKSVSITEWISCKYCIAIHVLLNFRRDVTFRYKVDIYQILCQDKNGFCR